eukprot:508550-Lingulodinium_polyedra.AAC.1
MAVSQALSGRVAEAGCHNQRTACATLGCFVCPRCPMHVDRANQSWTLLVLSRSRRSPWANRAWVAASDAP